MTKGRLSGDDCATLTAEFQAWNGHCNGGLWGRPSAGYHMMVGYTEGMGTHHAMLGDFEMDGEYFNPAEDGFPGTDISSVFDYSKPEFLMFAGG